MAAPSEPVVTKLAAEITVIKNNLFGTHVRWVKIKESMKISERKDQKIISG
jgi:hypothetical protein